MHPALDVPGLFGPTFIPPWPHGAQRDAPEMPQQLAEDPFVHGPPSALPATQPNSEWRRHYSFRALRAETADPPPQLPTGGAYGPATFLSTGGYPLFESPRTASPQKEFGRPEGAHEDM